MQPFKKVIFIGAALLLIAALFTTAQADYLGPNRVIVTYETIYQRQACRFVDVRDLAGPGVCACTMKSYLIFSILGALAGVLGCRWCMHRYGFRRKQH